MKNFELTLNLTNNFSIGGASYPVIKDNLAVGTCMLHAINNDVTGHFSLKRAFKKEQYLKYNTKIEDGIKWLVNLELSDFETSESVQSITPVS